MTIQNGGGSGGISHGGGSAGIGDGGTACMDPYNTVEGWGGGRKPVVSIGDGGTKVITSTETI